MTVVRHHMDPRKNPAKKKSKAQKQKKYKLKTHQASKLRFWWTAGGQCMRMPSGKRHANRHKSRNRCMHVA